MKKGLLKAFGFMILIGVIYLIANIIVTAGFVLLLFIQNTSIFSGDPVVIIDVMLQGMSQYLLHIVIGANLLSLLIISLVFLARKDKLIDYCKFRKVKLVDAFIVVGFGIFMNLLFVAILSAISNISAFSKQLDDYVQMMEPLLNSPFYLMFLAIAIVAPLFEEIIMRGIILNDFKKVTPVWLAIIIQALAFGLMHFNVVQSSYAAVLGLVLGVIYIKYKSIWMPILFHFGFNFTSLISDKVLGEEVSLLLLGIIGFVGSLLFLYMAKVSYKQDFYEEDDLGFPMIGDEEVIDGRDI